MSRSRRFRIRSKENVRTIKRVRIRNKKDYGVKYIAVDTNYTGLIGGGNTKRKAIKVLKEAIEMYKEVKKGL